MPFFVVVVVVSVVAVVVVGTLDIKFLNTLLARLPTTNGYSEPFSLSVLRICNSPCVCGSRISS
jgi:hypothetical protein